MINAELIDKIKAEIERRKLLLTQHSKLTYDLILETFIKEYDNLLSFLSTIESEKPINQEELDQEIIKCWQEWISPSNKQSVEGVLPLSEFAFYARHFAQWGAEHLKK